MLRFIAIALIAAASPAGAEPFAPEAPAPPGVILDADGYYGSKKGAAIAPAARPGEWLCWVNREELPYRYRLDWSRPAPEWERAYVQAACQHPQPPRQASGTPGGNSGTPAPRFIAVSAPGSEPFVDPSPSFPERPDAPSRRTPNF